MFLDCGILFENLDKNWGMKNIYVIINAYVFPYDINSSLDTNSSDRGLCPYLIITSASGR